MSAHSADDQAQANPWTAMIPYRPMIEAVDGYQQVAMPWAKSSGFVPSHEVCEPSTHQQAMAKLVTDMKDKMTLSEGMSVTPEPKGTLKLLQPPGHLSMSPGRFISLNPRQLAMRVPWERPQNPLSDSPFSPRNWIDPSKKVLLDAHKRQLAAMLAAKKAKRSKATPAKGLKATRASPPQPLPGNILGISWDDPGFSDENVKRFLRTRNRRCRVKKAIKNRVPKARDFEYTEFELIMPDTAPYKLVFGKKPLHGGHRLLRNCPPRVQVDENKVRVPAIENTSDEMAIQETNSMDEGMGLTFPTY